MSASYLTDLGNTVQMGVSITDGPLLSGGLIAVASGTTIGQGINMNNANSFCNLCLTGISSSGRLRVQVQCADTDTSGSYTDPTSGLPQLPTAFSSGGILWVNSGLDNGLLGPVVSGQSIASGFQVAAGFQRTGTFVRANVLTEGTAQFGGSLTASFISQLRTTGSGAGFSWAPSSGTSINV